MVHRSYEVPVSVSQVHILEVLNEDTHEFDGHLLVVQKVGALEDDTKGTLSNFLAHTVVDAHYIRRRRCHNRRVARVAIRNESFAHREIGFRDVDT